jgi:hypothetical protein
MNRLQLYVQKLIFQTTLMYHRIVYCFKQEHQNNKHETLYINIIYYKSKSKAIPVTGLGAYRDVRC